MFGQQPNDNNHKSYHGISVSWNSWEWNVNNWSAGETPHYRVSHVREIVPFLYIPVGKANDASLINLTFWGKHVSSQLGFPPESPASVNQCHCWSVWRERKVILPTKLNDCSLQVLRELINVQTPPRFIWISVKTWPLRGGICSTSCAARGIWLFHRRPILIYRIMTRLTQEVKMDHLPEDPIVSLTPTEVHRSWG